ncbi:hypothetical protein GE118_00865 [Mycoplasma sp. NEAQ87857]|uniref:hypothetical protein n=1 Tax=Mycoplasma sp. NEAQ87857 TaxID=2683967 RepID=UPI00131626DA|nr:hypothetical protein [Mycoplasma sp. NEAQ87857]QGZ97353.1 hypothetical protein GE118_00865 [Mycoplasma sp. NEAQ87857]
MTKTGFYQRILFNKFFKLSLILLLFIIFIYFLYRLNVFNLVDSNYKEFWLKVKQLFSFGSFDNELPGQNLWLFNLKLLWTSIKNILLATSVAFIFALFISFLNASILFKKPYLSWITRTISLLLRAFPVIVMLLFFKWFIVNNHLKAFIIYFWFTWLFILRNLNDIINTSSITKYWHFRYLGNSFVKSIKNTIILPNINRYIMLFFYSLESNLRWSTILIYVGINGIGFYFQYDDFQYLGISILYIMITIFSFELLLYFINNYLNKGAQIKTKKQTIYPNIKKITKILIIFLLSIFLIYLLIDLILNLINSNNPNINIKALEIFFKRFFILDFSSINNNPDIYLIYITIFMQVYCAIYIALFSAIIYVFVMNNKLNKPFNIIFWKLILSILKALPTILIFKLLNPLFSTSFALVLALSFSSFRKITKHLNELVNSLTQSKIDFLKGKRINNFIIYYKFILKEAIFKLFIILFFEFENSFRNAMTYSVFVGSGLDLIINKYQQENQFGKIIPLILPAYLLFILFELIYLAVVNQWILLLKNTIFTYFSKVKLKLIKNKNQ